MERTSGFQVDAGFFKLKIRRNNFFYAKPFLDCLHRRTCAVWNFHIFLKHTHKKRGFYILFFSTDFPLFGAHESGTGRDQPPYDHIFFQTSQAVSASFYGIFYENSVGVLE